MQGEPEQPKFAVSMAHYWVQREAKKPLLGKPHFQFGKAAIVCGHLFQQSALLGRALSSARVPFLTVFCTTEEPTEEAATNFAHMASEKVLPYLESVDSINSLVLAMLKGRVHGEGDFWFLRWGSTKMPIGAAVTLAYDYQLTGAGFGIHQPHLFEQLFNNTYKHEDPEDWRMAFELGVVDTAQQPDVSIELWERNALELFTGFCKESYPQMIQPLGLGG